MSLSKIDFIGGIKLSTPNCVMEDICSAYGIIFDSSKNILPQKHAIMNMPLFKKFPLDDLDESIESKRKIASYLNCNKGIKWTCNTLERAFEFTRNVIITGGVNHDDFNDDDHYGYPTPENPCRLSPAIIYGLLVKKDVHIYNTESTIEQIRDMFKMTKQRKILITHSIQNNLKLCTKAQLIMLTTGLESTNLEPYEYNPKLLEKALANIPEDYSVKFSAPTTHEYAIVLAAKIYKKDITNSPFPMAEYYAIRDNEKKFPLSKSMAQVYRINPHAFSIRSTFNPVFPIEIYGTETLKNFSLKYNFGISRPQEIYNRLQLQYLTDNFYRGLKYGVLSFETQIGLINVLEEECDSPIVSYGSSGKYKIFLLSEIINMFEAYQNFQYNSEMQFTSDAIDGLYIMSHHAINSRVQSTLEEKTHWRSIHDLIVTIRSSLGSFTEIKTNLRDIIESYTQEDRELSIAILMKLFYASIYARGYKGEEKYPLAEEDTNNMCVMRVPKNYDVTECEDKTGLALFELIEMSNNKVGEYILSLPLLRIFSGELQKSTDSEQGIAIRDRVEIVMNKIGAWNCIRMSSNWFLVSSFVYLMEFGVKLPFDIVNAEKS